MTTSVQTQKSTPTVWDRVNDAAQFMKEHPKTTLVAATVAVAALGGGAYYFVPSVSTALTSASQSLKNMFPFEQASRYGWYNPARYYYNAEPTKLCKLYNFVTDNAVSQFASNHSYEIGSVLTVTGLSALAANAIRDSDKN